MNAWNRAIAAWNLVKDNIAAAPIDGEIEYSEQNILDYYPYTGFEGTDKSNFWSVFKGIEASGFHTKKGYAKIIQDEWKNRGVSFKENSVSLISCFSYASDNKWLWLLVKAKILLKRYRIISFRQYNMQYRQTEQKLLWSTFQLLICAGPSDRRF